MERTEAFRLLASADRQYVLHELLDDHGELTIAELSRRVAARRHRIAPENLSDTEIEYARIRLAHTHLPRLTDRGVVRVDPDERTVALADGAAVDELVEAAEVLLDEWPPERRLKRSQ